jgi:hypothetical protein
MAHVINIYGKDILEAFESPLDFFLYNSGFTQRLFFNIGKKESPSPTLLIAYFI